MCDRSQLDVDAAVRRFHGYVRRRYGVTLLVARGGAGGLDREFSERLVNVGVHFHQMRHRAIYLHRKRPRPCINTDSRSRNRAFREHTRRERIAGTPYGIVQGDAPPAPPARGTRPWPVRVEFTAGFARISWILIDRAAFARSRISMSKA